MVDKITKPTMLPPQDAPISTLLATDKPVKKAAKGKIAPPEIGLDSPKFLPTFPIPTVLELESKEPTTWRSQPVGGLWTTDQNLNGWLWFAQENWVRVSDATESGLMAMMMLGGSGKETGTPCLYRKDVDGEIKEMYIL
jgi:hypothetical protein